MINRLYNGYVSSWIRLLKYYGVAIVMSSYALKYKLKRDTIYLCNKTNKNVRCVVYLFD